MKSSTRKKFNKLTLPLVAYSLFSSGEAFANYAYVGNYVGNTVSVIDTSTNLVTVTIPMPGGVMEHLALRLPLMVPTPM